MQGNTLSKRMLLALIDQLHDAIFAIQDGRMIYFNKQSEELFGYTHDELYQMPITDLIYAEDRDEVMQRYQDRLQGFPVPHETAFRILTRQGEARNVKMRIGLLTLDDGSTLTIGSINDVTDQINTMTALAASQQDIKSILDNMPDVFYRTDMQGVITLMSPSSFDAIGYTPEQMIGRPMDEFYWKPEDRDSVVQKIREGKGKAQQVEARLKNRKGEPIWVSTNAYLRFDEHGNQVGIEGIARNINEKKLLEEQLAELSKLDDLTRLYSRRYFFENAEKQIGIAQRYQRPVSVMMLDLDHFKAINDQYGHKAGDMALVYFADACRALFRKTDIIGRMGGEEFAVLMPETDIHPAREMVERLRADLQLSPFQYNNKPILLTFSAGMVELGSEQEKLDDLLLKADQLLYQAKNLGRDQVIAEET